MQDSATPLTLEAALDQIQDLLDGPADRNVLLDHEYTQHWLTAPNPLVGKVSHRPNVVGENLAIIERGTFEDHRVRSAPRANALHPNEIEIRPVIPQARRDVAVEVFIGQETKHTYCGCGATRERSRSRRPWRSSSWASSNSRISAFRRFAAAR